MAAKITRLPEPASPTIEQVFDESWVTSGGG